MAGIAVASSLKRRPIGDLVACWEAGARVGARGESFAMARSPDGVPLTTGTMGAMRDGYDYARNLSRARCTLDQMALDL